MLLLLSPRPNNSFVLASRFPHVQIGGGHLLFHTSSLACKGMKIKPSAHQWPIHRVPQSQLLNDGHIQGPRPELKSMGMRWDDRRTRVGARTGHRLRWWIALYHPAVPDDANIYYNLIWAAIYLSLARSIKMNTTVVRIDCNFLSFSSMKEHFWHKNNILGVLGLLFNCSSSDQLSCYICQEV